MLSEPSGKAWGDLDVSVGRTLARLGRHVETALANVELTTAQFRVLAQLGDGAHASSSLAANLAVSRPSVTAVVEGLAQRGLVDRKQSGHDRRWISVTLTKAGRDVLNRADDALCARLEDLLGRLAHDDAVRAVDGIRRWQAPMDAYRSSRAQERQARDTE